MPVYKDTKRKTWQAEFSYTDSSGKRKRIHRRGFRTKKDAQEFEREYLTTQHFDADMTFGAVCNLWFNEKQHILKPGTLANYEYAIMALKDWQNLKMEEIDEAKVIAMQQSLIRRGLAPSTIHKYETAAHTLYSFGAKRCGVTSDPFENVSKAGKPPEKRRFNFWTVEQYLDFRATLDDEIGTPFDVLFFTGLRIGELMGLHLDDIDLQQGRLCVRRTYAWHEGAGIEHEPKTKNSIRDVTISSWLCTELADYIAKTYKPVSSMRVFQYSHQFYLDTLNRYCASRPDVPRITIHGLRHSHAAFLANNREDYETIQERLGHSKASITMDIYGHLYPGKQKAVANMMEQYNPKSYKKP